MKYGGRMIGIYFEDPFIAGKIQSTSAISYRMKVIVYPIFAWSQLYFRFKSLNYAMWLNESEPIGIGSGVQIVPFSACTTPQTSGK